MRGVTVRSTSRPVVCSNGPDAPESACLGSAEGDAGLPAGFSPDLSTSLRPSTSFRTTSGLSTVGGASMAMLHDHAHY